jgi:two-component system sensor histidine kinase ChiS
MVVRLDPSALLGIRLIIGSLLAAILFGLPGSGSLAMQTAQEKGFFQSSIIYEITDLSAIRFQHITVNEGLSQSSIHSILQNKIGFMWFATDEGLNRFDGSAFKLYVNDPDNPNSLSDNNVLAIAEDQAGFLWLGTFGGGLNRFDPQTQEFTRFLHDPQSSDSPSANEIWSVLVDQSGSIWLATAEGLDRFDPASGHFQHFISNAQYPSGLSQGSIQAMFQDDSGDLWIGTEQGLDRLDRDTQQFSHYRVDARDVDPKDPEADLLYLPSSEEQVTYGLGGTSVSAIHQDQQGLIWVGTDASLDCLDPETDQFRHYFHSPFDPSSLGGNTISAIEQDRFGNLWIAIRSGGLSLFHPDTGQFSNFYHSPNEPYSLAGGETSALYADLQGNLWIGTSLSGVDRLALDTAMFSHLHANLKTPNSLLDNTVFAIYQDPEGYYWFGSVGGLDRWDRRTGEFTHYVNNPDDPNSLSNNWVTAIASGDPGELWVGTFRGGLNRLDLATGKFTVYARDRLNPAGMSSNVVLSLHQDRSGSLWVGTYYGGLARFDQQTGEFIHYLHDPQNPNSLIHDRVWAIYEDRQGALWIGTGGGLDRFDPQTEYFTHFPIESQVSTKENTIDVLGIVEDDQGLIWITTYGNGIYQYDPAVGSFMNFRIKDGLPGDIVYGILNDQQGFLWLSTNRGLSRFDPRKKIFKNFNAKDGLQSDEFNSGAFFQTSNGELFFGGINGVTFFFPEQIVDNTMIPPIILTSLTRGGDPIQTEKSPEIIQQVILNWPNNYFEFEFVALDYTNPEENQYAYQLIGFDKEWNYLGVKNSGRYTNIPGGTYTLNLKGSNHDGVWNETGVKIQVKVIPPLWENWWVRGSLVLLLAVAIYGAYQGRVKGIQSRNRELESQVRERMKEIEQLFEQTKELAVVEERNRLARDLHDSAKQKAFAALAQLGTAKSLVTNHTLSARNHLEEAENLVYEVIQELTFLIQEMYPLALQENGLINALREYFYEWENRNEIPVTFKVEGEQSLPLATAQAVYRIIQETLANVARHSQANHVAVSITFLADSILVIIADDGLGFDPGKKLPGVGLRSMRERTGMIGGQLAVESDPGKGTKIILSAPFQAELNYQEKKHHKVGDSNHDSHNDRSR